MTHYKQKNNLEFNIALLVPILTIFAYVITYSYKSGYYNYFNIPKNLIQIELIDILLVTGSLLVIYLFTIGIVNILTMFVKDLHPYIKNMLFSLSPFIVILIGFIYIHDGFNKEDYQLLIFIIFLLTFSLLFPLITQRKIKGYYNKIDAQIKHENIVDKEFKGFFNKVIESLPKWIFISIILLYFCSIIAYEYGETCSTKQTNYLLLMDENFFVVLEKINDNYIIAKLNKEDKTIENNFRIISISDQKNEYIYQKIGPLKLKEEK